MVSEVVARSVGALGMAWVRRALKDGHELSEAVLRSTSLEIGDVLAFLPATVGKNDAVRFGAAIFTALGLGGGTAAMSQDAAIAFAGASGGDVLVLETSWPRDRFGRAPVDETLYPPGRAIVGRTVFYWRPLGEGDGDIAAFLSNIGGYDNAFVVRSGTQRNEALMKQSWPEVARLLTAVLVPTYDAESFLVWTPAAN